MKRDELKALLEDTEMTAETKLAKIMELNGIDVEREKAKTTLAESNLQTLSEQLNKAKDYDEVKKERDELKAEKGEREFNDRFVQALGERKAKNDFTFNGLKTALKEAVANETNKGKTDAELLEAIIGDKSAEYFEDTAKPKINIPPTAPSVADNQSTSGKKYPEIRMDFTD